MKIRSYFFTTLVLFVTPSFASKELHLALEKINSIKLYDHKQWLSLGHYSKTLFGGHESRADGKAFFFSKHGKKNPKQEILETTKAIFSQQNIKDYNDHPICRFPARFNFLKKNLNIKGLSTSKCIKQKKFIKKLAAKSVSLVFSSYYLDTPASAFGHTLIRLGKEKNNKFELLDYATNYAANPTTGNAFLYGLLGMVGGFRGEFAAMPYFYKVREYNDFESRDLWDYELNLSQEEVNMITFHIWEMSQTYFDYYYFDENCSYFMLALLDTASDKWNLANRTSTFVAPVDTIKLVTKTPGLLRRVSYRPSKMRVTKQNLKKLSKEEFSEFEKIYHSKNPLLLSQNNTEEKKAKILDSVLDYLDFKHAAAILKEEPTAMKWKRDILIARSKTGIQSPNKSFTIPLSEQPHEGHGSRRVGLGLGNESKNGNYTQFELRFTLHDFLDPRVGQNPNATMEMGNSKIRFYPKDKTKNKTSNLRLEEFALVRVKSLSPLEPLFNKFSWRFFLGTRTIKDKTCDNCLAPSVQVGSGYSQEFKKFKYYLFGVGEVDLNKEFGHEGALFGAGPEFSAYYHFSDNFNFRLLTQYRFLILSEESTSYKFEGQARYQFIKDYAIDFKISKSPRVSETSLTLYSYY